MVNTFDQSAKALDHEFSQNLRILSKAVAATNHPLAKYCMSRYIELYIRQKVDVELIKSFHKVFK